MSFNIGELVGHIKIDHAGVKTGMDAAQREVQSGQAKIGQASEQGGKQAGGRFSSGVSSATKAGLAAVTSAVVGAFAVGKVVAYLGDATQAASDLQQTAMKSDNVFGSASTSVNAWAKGSVNAFGLSEEAALAAASQFGDMFQQLGDTQDQAAKTSMNVVQLASDLGSFNNLPTGDVLERISAAMRGEYDSLQLLIPNINAARVETEAMTETGKTSAKQLTAQEKAHATLAIIQKDGARAQGDFARSSGTLAVEQQKTAAASENLKAKIGEKLLPIMTAFTQLMSGTVIPGISSFVDVLSTLASAVADVPGPVKAAVVALTLFHLLRGPVSAMGTAAQVSFQKIMTGAKGAGGALGLLKGAGSGILSVFGGPWGIAFAGAAAVVGKWIGSQAEASARADEFRSTLDQQTGAITQNTKTLVANQLSQQDFGQRIGDVTGSVLKAARALGIQGETVVDAALGQADALKLITDGADAARNAYDNLKKREAAGLPISIDEKRLLYERSAGYRQLLGIVGETTDAYGPQVDAQKEAAAAAGLQADKTNAVAGAATEADPKVATLAETTKLLADAAKGAKEQQQQLSKATLDVADAAISADSANADLEASYDDARKAINENGRSVNKNRTALNLNTKAGRDNQGVLQTIATKASAAAEANLKNGRSVGSTKAQMDRARATFIENARRAGLSGAAAAAMATKYGLTRGRVDALNASMGKTPKQVASEIKVATAAANLAIRTTQALLASINGQSSTATIRVNRINRVENILESKSAAARRFGGRVPGYAGGTLVGPGTGTSDSISAFVAETGKQLMVSTGEFISTDSSRRRNREALEAGNKGARLGVIRPGEQSQGSRATLTDMEIDRIARAFARVQVKATVSAGSFDRAMGGTR